MSNSNADEGIDDKIETISEIGDFNYENAHYTGYRIKTTKQEIWGMIENCNLCCEEWGYGLHFPDERKERVGDIVRSVKWGKDVIDSGTDKMQASIVIETNQGSFQIRLWNTHNGYYPHKLYVSWMNYKDDTESL
jgi:hypothetical protein